MWEAVWTPSCGIWQSVIFVVVVVVVLVVVVFLQGTFSSVYIQLLNV